MAKVVIPTSKIKGKNEFQLPSTHITTFDIGHLRPTFIAEALAGDTLRVKFRQSTITTPLVVPTFGGFKMVSHAFFVPYTSVWRNYESFRKNSHDSSVVSDPVNFLISSFVHALFSGYQYPDYSQGELGVSEFLEGIAVERISQHTTVNNFETLCQIIQGYCGQADDFMHADLILYEVQKNESYEDVHVYSYNFTNKGRWLMNIMRSLGYELPRFMPYVDWSTPSLVPTWFFAAGSPTTLDYSVYPLLAFCRALYDYVYSSAYLEQQGFTYLFEEETWKVDDLEIEFAPLLRKIFDLFFVPYSQNYFTSLWQTPNSVSSGSGASSVSFHTEPGMERNSGANHYLSVSSGNNSVVTAQDSSSWNGTLTAAGLRWLQATADFCLRNNVGGTRFHEWMRTHFNYSSREIDKFTSKHLKSFSDDVAVRAVSNQTAPLTDDAPLLGELAANASSKGFGEFVYDAKEDGFLIFVSMLVPYTGYYQGDKPFACGLHDYTELYLPEYDSVGMEGVPRRSVYSCFDDNNSPNKVNFNTLFDVFGYATRYSNRYKRSYDFLTGDFRFKSLNSNLDPYHTFRDVLYGRSNLALDLDFLSVDNQYDRIFAVRGNSSPDHFLSIFQFGIEKYSGMRKIAESLPFFDRSGEKVDVNYEGTQL